jgi:hypothetical protein
MQTYYLFKFPIVKFFYYLACRRRTEEMGKQPRVRSSHAFLRIDQVLLILQPKFR